MLTSGWLCGSVGMAGAVCQSYAGIDRRIVVIDKNNSGVSATRNLGMQEAHGKYFQFVDADDFIQPYATELLVQKAPRQKTLPGR